MTSEKFEELIDQLETESLKTLKEKNRKYTAKSGDALHNFRTGAAVDGTTMPQTIWHYWKKHFVSLLDKIKEDNWADKEDALEKIQDSINYLRFMWCAINDDEPVVDHYEINTENDSFNYDFKSSDWCCSTCKFGYIIENDECWNEDWNKIITEPCASCKGNFVPMTSEYCEAKLNYVPEGE